MDIQEVLNIMRSAEAKSKMVVGGIVLPWTFELTVLPKTAQFISDADSLFASVMNVSEKVRQARLAAFSENVVKPLLRTHTPVMVALHETCGVDDVVIGASPRRDYSLDITVAFETQAKLQAFEAKFGELLANFFRKAA